MLYRGCLHGDLMNSYRYEFSYESIGHDVDIILADCYSDFAENTDLAFLSQDYDMIVPEATHISGSLLDHVYAKKFQMGNIFHPEILQLIKVYNGPVLV